MRTFPIAAALLVATSGCSWTTMTRPPLAPVEPSPAVDCTTSRAAPTLDVVGAVAFGIPGLVVSAWGIGQPVCSTGGLDCLFGFNSGGAKAATIGVGIALVGLAVVDAISAADGFTWARACEDMRGEQLACLSGVEASCASLRTPPPRDGLAPGERCAVDDQCREGHVCYRDRCQPVPPR